MTQGFSLRAIGVLSLLALASSAGLAQEEEKVLNIYNWSDYIAEDTIRNFGGETGIKVRYDNFDNNEIVHADPGGAQALGAARRS